MMSGTVADRRLLRITEGNIRRKAVNSVVRAQLANFGASKGLFGRPDTWYVGIEVRGTHHFDSNRRRTR